jgi:leucyl-tRNA synthetase
MPVDSPDEDVKAKALERVVHFTEGKGLLRIIVVKNKIVNIVIS